MKDRRADMKDLIENIVSDLKQSGDGDVTSKVYRDQPILITADQIKNVTPARFREMRRLATRDTFASAAEVFYEQARFMVDYEDDYEYHGTYSSYFPTYQNMTDFQLRGYFSWRTAVRQGIVRKTCIAFVYVYIYELLNLVGVNSPMEGFLALNNLWTAYRSEEPQIDRYPKLWMKDFVVYNNLDKSLLADLMDLNLDTDMLALQKYREYGPEAVFQAVNARSSYNLENSRFYKQHPEDMQTVLYNVYAALSAYYERSRKRSFCEKLFGKTVESPYAMFKLAVFCPRSRHLDAVYEINEIYKYKCRGGNWSCERFLAFGGRNKQVGALLKDLDFYMRKAYGVNSALKEIKTAKLYLDVIQEEIERFLQAQEKSRRPSVEIDLSKLQQIRSTAQETQRKLIVEPEPEAPPPPPAEAPPAAPDDGPPDTAHGLSESERGLLHCLMYDRSYEALLKSEGLMLSLLTDSINDKLFDRFGDTVIAYEDDRPVLIQDYIEEMKGIIEE